MSKAVAVARETRGELELLLLLVAVDLGLPWNLGEFVLLLLPVLLLLLLLLTLLLLLLLLLFALLLVLLLELL